MRIVQFSAFQNCNGFKSCSLVVPLQFVTSIDVALNRICQSLRVNKPVSYTHLQKVAAMFPIIGLYHLRDYRYHHFFLNPTSLKTFSNKFTINHRKIKFYGAFNFLCAHDDVLRGKNTISNTINWIGRAAWYRTSFYFHIP